MACRHCTRKRKWKTIHYWCSGFPLSVVGRPRQSVCVPVESTDAFQATCFKEGLQGSRSTSGFWPPWFCSCPWAVLSPEMLGSFLLSADPPPCLAAFSHAVFLPILFLYNDLESTPSTPPQCFFKLWFLCALRIFGLRASACAWRGARVRTHWQETNFIKT